MRKLAVSCLALVMAMAVPALAAETPLRQPTGDESPADRIIEAGGTPGEINVMVDGTCIPFQEVFPVIESGRTMVPLRAAMEFLGARVDYDKTTRTASVTGEDVAFTHVIGTDTLTMADGTTVTMDVASAVRSGSTLVPLRFFSQALRYDLYWDADLRCAVVFDAERMIAGIDEDFTVVNGFLAAQLAKVDCAEPIRRDVTLSADVKLPDSIDGDRTARVSGEMEVLSDTEAINVSGRSELGELVRLWEQMAGPAGGEDTGAARYFSPMVFGAIYAGEGEYFYAGISRQPGSEETAASAEAEAIAGGIGNILSMSAARYADILVQTQPVTVGHLLYGAHFGEAGAETMREFRRQAALYALLIGDETWTRSGSEYRWHFGEEEQEKISAFMGYNEYTIIPFDTVDVTLRSDGSCQFSAETGSAYYDSYGGTKTTVKGTADQGKIQLTGFYQVKNRLDVSFTLHMATQNSDKAPLRAPTAAWLSP